MKKGKGVGEGTGPGGERGGKNEGNRVGGEGPKAHSKSSDFGTPYDLGTLITGLSN